MTRAQKFLRKRDTLVLVGLVYFSVAALVGGPWFALFSAGLIVLALGGLWWLNRERRVRRIGTALVGVGLMMTASGLAVGNIPTELASGAFGYRSIDARPTPVVASEAAAVVPLPRDEASPSPTPTPSPSETHITSRSGERSATPRPSTKATSAKPTRKAKSSPSPSVKPSGSPSTKTSPYARPHSPSVRTP